MSQMCLALTLSTIILFKTNEKIRAEILTGVIWIRSMSWIMPYSVIQQILPENNLLNFCRKKNIFFNLNFWLTFFISSPSGLSLLQMPHLLSRFVMTLAANLMSFLQTFLSTVKPVTVRIRRERSRLTIGPNSQSLQTKIEQKIKLKMLNLTGTQILNLCTVHTRKPNIWIFKIWTFRTINRPFSIHHLTSGPKSTIPILN